MKLPVISLLVLINLLSCAPTQNGGAMFSSKASASTKLCAGYNSSDSYLAPDNLICNGYTCCDKTTGQIYTPTIGDGSCTKFSDGSMMCN